jgi:hypothetical protein
MWKEAREDADVPYGCEEGAGMPSGQCSDTWTFRLILWTFLFHGIKQGCTIRVWLNYVWWNVIFSASLLPCVSVHIYWAESTGWWWGSQVTVGLQHFTCLISCFWHLEYAGGFQIFGKFVDLWPKEFITGSWNFLNMFEQYLGSFWRLLNIQK